MINYQLATRFLAEAMGWERGCIHTNGCPAPDSWCVWKTGEGKEFRLQRFRSTFHPHKHIENAWVVVEWIRNNREDVWSIDIVSMREWESSEAWDAEFVIGEPGDNEAEAPTAPEAIFLAACKLLLTEEQQKECGL